MKALFTLESAKKIAVVITLAISITPLVYPEVMRAALSPQTQSNQQLVFEIKDFSKIQTQNLLNINAIISEDPLTKNLKSYLEKHGSPLAQYAEEIPNFPQWQRALAISWVESNFGKHCPGKSNNCSGIGVAPGHPLWRTYPTKLDWFEDLSKLLEKPIYKERYTTCKKMKGIYVYPGSSNWVYGCEKKLNELNQLTEDAEQERITLLKNFELALAK